MPSESTRLVPGLIPLEKAGPKGYIRTAFPFELGDDYDVQEVFKILLNGLEAAKQRIPTLACEGVPDLDSKQAGVLKLQMADDLDSITCRDLRGTFPHTYTSLKSKGFPVAAFPGDELFRRFVWPSPGERLKVIDAQANFIRGGLILTCAFFHVFGDAKAYHTWCEIWAEECRRLQGLPVPDPESSLPEEMFTDREKVMVPSGRNPGRYEDHPEITVLPFTPPGFPPKLISREHAGQVFYLSPKARKELKELAQPVHATTPVNDVEWVSNNDAFSALIWRSVMAAQFPLDQLQGDPISVFNIAVDCRLRTDPPVHERTLGCFLGWVAPQMSIREILTGSLADVAVTIRRAVARLDNQYADDVQTMIERVEDVDRVVATAFLDVPGNHCVQSSWINFLVCDLDWGNMLGGRAQALRCPDVGIVNGGSAVLPVTPDGGIEMIVGVEKKCLERLLRDELLQQFAQPRIL